MQRVPSAIREEEQRDRDERKGAQRRLPKDQSIDRVDQPPRKKGGVEDRIENAQSCWCCRGFEWSADDFGDGRRGGGLRAREL